MARQRIGSGFEDDDWDDLPFPGQVAVDWDDMLARLFESVVVLRKDDPCRQDDAIGQMFRKINMIRTLTPDDPPLDFCEYDGTMAFCCIYAMDMLGSDETSEVTLTIVCPAKPVEFLRAMASDGKPVSRALPGIYYMPKDSIFPTQIVVVEELENAAWLKAHNALTLNREDAITLVADMDAMDEWEVDWGLRRAALQTAVNANHDLFRELRADSVLACRVLDRLKIW